MGPAPDPHTQGEVNPRGIHDRLLHPAEQFSQWRTPQAGAVRFGAQIIKCILHITAQQEGALQPLQVMQHPVDLLAFLLHVFCQQLEKSIIQHQDRPHSRTNGR
jgi:hypothetical protein